jgi:hypothetical protein
MSCEAGGVGGVSCTRLRRRQTPQQQQTTSASYDMGADTWSRLSRPREASGFAGIPGPGAAPAAAGDQSGKCRTSLLQQDLMDCYKANCAINGMHCLYLLFKCNVLYRRYQGLLRMKSKSWKGLQPAAVESEKT